MRIPVVILLKELKTEYGVPKIFDYIVHIMQKSDLKDLFKSGRDYNCYSRLFNAFGKSSQLLSREQKEFLCDFHHKFMLNSEKQIFIENQADVALCLITFYPTNPPPSMKKSIIWFLKNLQMGRYPKEVKHLNSFLYIISHIMNKINRNVDMFGSDAVINRIPSKVGEKVDEHLNELHHNNKLIWTESNTSIEELMEIIYSVSTINATNKTLISEFFKRITNHENIESVGDKKFTQFFHCLSNLNIDLSQFSDELEILHDELKRRIPQLAPSLLVYVINYFTENCKRSVYFTGNSQQIENEKYNPIHDGEQAKLITVNNGTELK